MIFRQLFDQESGTYTYLLGTREGQERGSAIIIDPVRRAVPSYLQLLGELELDLRLVLDTHVHADHVTGAGLLRERSGCQTLMGVQSRAACISARFHDGEILTVSNLSLKALYTPGHTDDSYSFLMNDRVFTGDTLLIRGTGRTDFQNGNAHIQYDSLGRLLALPDETLVYPGHDYKGWTVSTIGEERRHNPRLQVHDADEYAALMGNLNLPNPRLMDLAVPANLACGMNA